MSKLQDEFKEYLDWVVQIGDGSLDEYGTAWVRVDDFLTPLRGGDVVLRLGDDESLESYGKRLVALLQQIAEIAAHSGYYPPNVQIAVAQRYWSISLELVDFAPELYDHKRVEDQLCAFIRTAPSEEILTDLEQEGENSYFDELSQYLEIAPASVSVAARDALLGAIHRVTNREHRPRMQTIADAIDAIAQRRRQYEEKHPTAVTEVSKTPVGSTSMPTYPTIDEYFASDPRTLKIVHRHFTNSSKVHVVAALNCQLQVNGGMKEILVFTPSDIVIIAKGMMGTVTDTLRKDDVLEIDMGTAHHTQYSGFVSSESEAWVIEILMKSGASYTRFLPLGSGERQVNAMREHYTRQLRVLAQMYEVTSSGEHIESSDGYTTSIGYGVWMGFD